MGSVRAWSKRALLCVAGFGRRAFSSSSRLLLLPSFLRLVLLPSCFSCLLPPASAPRSRGGAAASLEEAPFQSWGLQLAEKSSGRTVASGVWPSGDGSEQKLLPPTEDLRAERGDSEGGQKPGSEAALVGRTSTGAFTRDARFAYSRVLLESSKWSRPGCTLAIMDTRQSDVSEPLRSSVSLESRYGGFLRAEPPPFSVP
mmetsp:Transcript_8288/g.22122  ORF Transcript_8288/g.22122 Transcript_8288/m.22122 type:complete len:200 (-) Transcript_8288:763-1362(-)